MSEAIESHTLESSVRPSQQQRRSRAKIFDVPDYFSTFEFEVDRVRGGKELDGTGLRSLLRGLASPDITDKAALRASYPDDVPDDLDAVRVGSIGNVPPASAGGNDGDAAVMPFICGPSDIDAGRVINRPLQEVVLSADQKLPDGSFGCHMPFEGNGCQFCDFFLCQQCLISVSKKTSSNLSERHLTGYIKPVFGSQGVFDSHPGNHTWASHQHLGLGMGLDASCIPVKKVPFCTSTKANQVYPLHLLSRGVIRPVKNNNQQGARILMVNSGGVTDGRSIVDSGADVHISGDISLYTEHGPEPEGTKIYGPDGTEMECFGWGSIRIPSLGLELREVYYVPSVGNKTIVSVRMLIQLSYGVKFSKAGCLITDERSWTRKLVGKGRLVGRQFELEYLNISLDRAAVSDGTLTLLWRDVWMRWNRFTEHLFQRDERLPR